MIIDQFHILFQGFKRDRSSFQNKSAGCERTEEYAWRKIETCQRTVE